MLGAPGLDFETWETSSLKRFVILSTAKDLQFFSVSNPSSWVPQVSILRPGKPRIQWYETIRSEIAQGDCRNGSRPPRL
jgi:hypothetical protein